MGMCASFALGSGMKTHGCVDHCYWLMPFFLQRGAVFPSRGNAKALSCLFPPWFLGPCLRSHVGLLMAPQAQSAGASSTEQSTKGAVVNVPPKQASSPRPPPLWMGRALQQGSGSTAVPPCTTIHTAASPTQPASAGKACGGPDLDLLMVSLSSKLLW